MTKPIEKNNSQLPTVLIVDDELELLKIMAKRLRRAGYTTFTAPSAHDALKVVDDEKIDIVITDMNMPILSGEDLLKELRKKDNRHPIVFIMTGRVDIDTIDLLDLGANDVFTKPLDFSKVKRALENSFNFSKSANPKERRDRFDSILKIDLKSKDSNEVIRVKSFNIARGGMYIEVSDGALPEVGQILVFDAYFSYNNADCVLSGESQVVWRRETRSETHPRGLGVKFLNLEVEGMREFQDYLYSLDTQAYIPRSA